MARVEMKNLNQDKDICWPLHLDYQKIEKDISTNQ